MPIKDYGSGGDGTDNDDQPIIVGERITAFNVSSKIQTQITNLYEYTVLKKTDYPSGGYFRGGKHLPYRIFNKKSDKELTHAHRSDGDTIVVLKNKNFNTTDSSGTGGSDSNGDTNSDYVPYMAGINSDGAKETDETTVHIITPSNSATVIRSLTGVDIDVVFPQTKSAKLTWSGTAAGSKTAASDSGNWVNRISLPPGDYELIGIVPDNTHTIQFTVILAPVLRGYTAEDIQLLNTFKWGNYNNSPEAELVKTLAREAGLVDEGDDFSDTVTGSVVTERVQNFSKQAKGDYNLFYSGSGDKVFIEKKINRLFGKHLSDETRTKLIDIIEAKKTAAFIDATDAFHEAMNNTLNIFFAKNSIGRTISEMNTALAVNPTMMLMMDTAKTVVNIKLNVELATASNGAPLLMRQEAEKNVFDMVALEVVSLAVGGVVLKALGKGLKVTRSYFKKYEHKFSKKGKFKTNGVIIKDPLITKQGSELFLQLRKADPSASNKDLLRRTKSLLSSGTELPKVSKATSGTILYKFVPKGSTVTKYTPYFMSKKEMVKFKNNPKLIADKMALPKVSEANSYDIYKITPISGSKPTIFVSEVASTTEGTILRKGGGIQTIVANRNDWKPAELIETIGY